MRKVIMAYHGRFSTISDEELKRVVYNSEYMSDVLLQLGYKRSSGTMRKIIARRCEKLHIDTGHLGYKKGHKGRGGHTSTYMTERRFRLSILIVDSPYKNISRIKEYLFRFKIKENKCEFCGLCDTWNNKHITLQLDHVNGNNTDHRLENMRILCPNCHSQTETYGSKNHAALYPMDGS